MKCCELHAGILRHSITIKRKTLASDGMGGGSVTWSTVGTCRARIKPVGSSEVYRFSKLNATVTHTVVCRYRSDIDASMTVFYGTRTFQIRGIKNIDEANRWLEIACEEGVAL